jgi:succinate-acetate transporter protein
VARLVENRHQKVDSMAQNDADESLAKPAAGLIANPAPLGLCAFALTTFVLSCANAGLYTGPQIVIGLALFYGGLGQLLAGMWEFKTGNTFGATAFTSYGAFWMAVAVTLQWKLITPGTTEFGYFLLGWTIFTFMLLLACLRTTVALIVLFALLFLTFLLLTMHEFGSGTGILGGYFGIATAIVAWYTALAGLLSSGKAAFTLPVGERP